MISGTPINLHGLVLTLFLIAAYWLLFRRILREDPETSIAALTITGGLAQLFSEVFFQLIRQFTYPYYTQMQHLYYYLQAIIIMTVFSVIVAFLVAYQLKQRRVLMLLLFAGAGIVVFDLLSHLLV